MNDFMLFTRKLMTREGFLSLMIASVAGLAGLAVSLPIIGTVLAGVINQPKNVWRDVTLVNRDGTLGQRVRVDTIELGLTEKVTYDNPDPLPWAGSTAKNTSWLRRTGPQDFIAFSNNCTHLGCPINWVQGGQLFLCPCHGSVFNGDGTVAAGPAARPLVRYHVRVVGRNVQIKTEPLPLVF